MGGGGKKNIPTLIRAITGSKLLIVKKLAATSLFIGLPQKVAFL